MPMGEHDDRSLALARLTPEFAAEVRRNLGIWLAATVAFMAVVSALFGIVADPTLSGVTGGAAVLVFAVFAALFVPCAGMLLALAYLFDCWPAFLRGRFLQERFGLPSESVSNQARRKEMGSGGYWAALARGAIVGWAFMSAMILVWWRVTGTMGFIVPSIVIALSVGQVAAQAWVVRRVVARQVPPVAGTQGSEPGSVSSPGAG
jgi:hypothetical protein